jgi:oxygen-independent coproporphyrinogen III oxidase
MCASVSPSRCNAARLGFWRVEDGAVVLNREGLLQVDRLLHEFFLPEHRNARYA